jgi:hypothetical protein
MGDVTRWQLMVRLRNGSRLIVTLSTVRPHRSYSIDGRIIPLELAEEVMLEGLLEPADNGLIEGIAQSYKLAD